MFKFFQSILQSIIDYIIPATTLYICLTIGYVLLNFGGLTQPFDQYRASWGDQIWILDAGFYLATVLLVAWFGFRGNWRTSQRWIMQSGSRRGLFLSRLPLLDIVVVGLCVVLLFFTTSRMPVVTVALSWLLLPLLAAFLLSLLNRRPDTLDDVISTDQDIAQYTQRNDIDEKNLIQENAYNNPSKPLQSSTQLSFGRLIYLPPKNITFDHIINSVIVLILVGGLGFMVSQAATNTLEITESQTATAEALIASRALTETQTATRATSSTPTRPPRTATASVAAAPSRTPIHSPTPTSSPSVWPTMTATSTLVPTRTPPPTSTMTPTAAPTIGSVSVTDPERLNVRQGPGANFPLSTGINKLDNGTQLAVLNTAPAGQGCSDIWYEVRILLDQSTGWVCSTFVTIQ